MLGCGNAEDELLVQVVFGEVADDEADDAAQVAHLRRSERMPEPVLEAPEDGGGHHAHEGVEHERPAVVANVLRLEAEDEALVEEVFDDQPRARADDDGEPDARGPQPQCKVLRANVTTMATTQNSA